MERYKLHGNSYFTIASDAACLILWSWSPNNVIITSIKCSWNIDPPVICSIVTYDISLNSSTNLTFTRKYGFFTS